MLQRIAFLLFFTVLTTTAFTQVKPAYLYNTGMPYGTLDLRTQISASNYYYLVPGKTFSFRENTPGVRTDSWLDMTNWDSSPYDQGHMRHRDGSSDDFAMNYRLLFPSNYQQSYSRGYPMIVIMHGAVERGNCYYEDCYHGDWNYDPNANTPPAPTNADNKLLNNDHHLSIGANQHLAARNRAGSKLPDDPTLDARAFPGFVLMPQMFNDWDSVNVEKMIKIVMLHVDQYNIDPNRIYIHGLSIGGYATYEAIKRAPWLFAAALPMSAVREAGNIFRHNQQDRVNHIPLWIFQGGRDQDPTVEWTAGVMNKLRNAGSVVRYNEYADLGHNVWNRAYNEPDFFSWMLGHNKSNIHALHGNKEINFTANTFPTLVLAEGFFAYQWEKDGEVIAGANGNIFIPDAPGTYRARFSRVASPSGSEWNDWSQPVVITSVGTPEEDDEGDEDNDSGGDDNAGGDDSGGEDNPGGDNDSGGEDTTGGEDNTGGEDDAGGEDDSGGDDNSGSEDNPGGEDDAGGEDNPGGEDNSGGEDDSGGGDDSGGEDSPGGEDDPGGEDNAGSEDDAGGEDNYGGNDGSDNGEPGNTDGDNDDPNPVTNIPAAKNYEVFVYPNPGRSEQIQIVLPDEPQERYQYRLIDPMGRIITAGGGHPHNGIDNLRLELPSGLPEGIYLLVISGRTHEHIARIAIKNK